MGESKQAPRSRLRMPYARQQAISLLIVGLLPLLVFSLIAFDRLGAALEADAAQQVRTAIASVQSILADDHAELVESAASYARWDTLLDEIAAHDDRAIGDGVIDFLVRQGAVDAAILLTEARLIGGGPEATIAALADTTRAALGASPGSPAATDIGPGYLALPDGIYQVAVVRVELGGRSGPGASGAAVGIAFARRLDPSFVLDVERFTGYRSAVVLRDGTVSVAAEPAAFAGFGILDPLAIAPGSIRVERRGSAVAGAVPLADTRGAVVGGLVVSGNRSVLDAIRGQLQPLLATALATTIALAVVLTMLLARRLRRRLVAVQTGMTAVTDGDLSVRVASGDRDELDRLAQSQNQLVTALRRRDERLRRSLDVADRLSPTLTRAAIGAEASRAAREIFGLADCVLREWQRRSTSDPEPTGAPLHVQAPVPVPDPALVLEGDLGTGATWSDADQAQFELFGRLVGSAIRDADLYRQSTRRADRLAEVNRLQGDFLRGVSHNLQAPLTNILGQAEELGQSADLTPEARARAAAIRSEAGRLARLVAQLLTLSRLEAGTYRPEAELFVMAPLVRRTWESLRSPRRLDVDDRSEGCLAVGDRVAVEQVVWMLLDNALRYAPDGPITVTIECRRARSSPATGSEAAASPERDPGPDRGGLELAVTVEDEGPGVPVDERARIFRRFQRGSTAAGHDGTGLGLDVARGLLRSMGGRIWYADGRSGGAAFVFTLPAEEALEPD